MGEKPVQGNYTRENTLLFLYQDDKMCKKRKGICVDENKQIIEE